MASASGLALDTLVPVRATLAARFPTAAATGTGLGVGAGVGVRRWRRAERSLVLSRCSDEVSVSGSGGTTARGSSPKTEQDVANSMAARASVAPCPCLANDCACTTGTIALGSSVGHQGCESFTTT